MIGKGQSNLWGQSYCKVMVVGDDLFKYSFKFDYLLIVVGIEWVVKINHNLPIGGEEGGKKRRVEKKLRTAHAGLGANQAPTVF